jgi:hypothetical protein
MNRRIAFPIALVCMGVVGPLMVVAQQQNPFASPSATELPRAIRRDMPMTNAIRRAFDAGTRDRTGQPGKQYWQIQTDYAINVRLDPATQTLTGSEIITLHNNSPQDLTDIVLRLDHNIFRARAPFAASWLPGEITEGMVITRLAVNGTAVELGTPGRAGGAGQRRLGVTGLDRTVARISLVEPVAARSRATVAIDWRTKLPAAPGSGHRMVQRFEDRLFQPTQWFPRIAKYDDLRGWDTNLYLGPSEFYNNFGRFDVRIDVPAGWIVSGTGVLQNPQEVLTARARERLAQVLASDEVITIVGDDEAGPGQATAAGDRLVWHHVADNVNDFAWATARKFTWKATRAMVPGKGAIPIHMVHLPERANLYTNAARISRHAVEFYSKLLAPYPFPQLTLQDGPSSGMEYPMVINSNQGAADHETAHQWWPMMVGNNETWYGWMDEGFNQYVNLLSEADSSGTAPNLNRLGQNYGRTSGNESEPPMMWNANYAGPDMYGFTTYSKTPLMLSMLGGIVGDDNVQRALGEFTKAWAWKHPSPWDFAHFMNNALKRDLNWFWYYWLWTTEAVNGKIDNVVTSGGRTTVTVRQDGEMPSPVVLRVRFADTGPAIKPMANAKIDGNSALVTWPVDVWFNGSRTFQAVLDFGGRTIQSIQLDPACRFPDRDANDNVWPKSPAPAGAMGPGAGATGTCAG